MTTPPDNATHATQQAQILQVALQNFASQDYRHTTLRHITEQANCSIETFYQHYPSKETLALAYYEQSMRAMLDDIDQLPFQTISERYVTILTATLERHRPQRSTIAALFAASMSREDSLIAEELSRMRADMITHFQGLVRGATDKPRDNIIDGLGTLLATGHILVTLFWLYDRTPQQEATTRLIAFIEDALKMLRPLLLMPIVGKAIVKLASVLADVFMPTSEA